MKSVAWFTAAGSLLLLLAGCGGGGGDSGAGAGGGGAGAGGGGGGGAGVTMNGWVHVTHPYWDYFKPTDLWIGTESKSGIEISSPTGGADVEFAFVYGPLIPQTVEQADAVVEEIFTNFVVVNQAPVVTSPYGGPSRTTEFTAVWKATGAAVHGRFTVDLGTQTFDTHLIMANVAGWSAIEATLQLIANHITACPGGTCGP
jgi:hypothetical protein